MMEIQPKTYPLKICLWIKQRKKNIWNIMGLKFDKKHGMRVICIDTVYQLNHSPWMTEFNKYLTEQRIKAETEFEKRSYKLINNSF